MENIELLCEQILADWVNGNKSDVEARIGALDPLTACCVGLFIVSMDESASAAMFVRFQQVRRFGRSSV